MKRANGGRCCRHNARSHPVIMQGSLRGYYAYTRRRALSFSLLVNACTPQQIIPVYWALVGAVQCTTLEAYAGKPQGCKPGSMILLSQASSA